jgi:serine protease Do
LSQFQATGKFIGKPYLGVEYQMITQQAALLNSVPQGAYVVSVVSGSPAEKAGIQANDIITKIDGQSVSGTNTDFSAIISGKKVGDTVKLDIYRNGQTVNVSVTLSDTPTQ